MIEVGVFLNMRENRKYISLNLRFHKEKILYVGNVIINANNHER